MMRYRTDIWGKKLKCVYWLTDWWIDGLTDGLMDLVLLSSLQVMQKLGKADETRDAAFEEMVSNFNKQMVGKVSVNQILH